MARAVKEKEIITIREREIRLIDDRNLTAHTYDEETAKAIFRSLKEDYLSLFEQLRQGLTSRLGSS